MEHLALPPTFLDDDALLENLLAVPEPVFVELDNFEFLTPIRLSPIPLSASQEKRREHTSYMRREVRRSREKSKILHKKLSLQKKLLTKVFQQKNINVIKRLRSELPTLRKKLEEKNENVDEILGKVCPPP